MICEKFFYGGEMLKMSRYNKSWDIIQYSIKRPHLYQDL